MERMLSDAGRARRGLIAALLVAGVIAAFAVVAPQAWATPLQSRLRATVPPSAIFASGPQGDPVVGCFSACDDAVYVVGEGEGGFPENATFMAYVTEDTLWITDTTTLDGLYVPRQVQIETHETTGDFGPTLLWAHPEPGDYDVFFDVGGDAEEFDDGDGVINPWAPGDAPQGEVSYGFCVDPCPVGGVTAPASTVGLAAPIFGLVALIGVVVAGFFVWRRRS